MTSTIVDRFQIAVEEGIKAPVRVATTAAITLSGLQTIDGVALVANDRVLVKDQADATENGIYVVRTTDWKRASDFNDASDATSGVLVVSSDGIANSNKTWIATFTGSYIPGTTSITFSSFVSTSFGFDSVQDLRDSALPPTRFAVTSGYTTPGDGGGALYYLDAADAVSADDSFLVLVASDGGRWKLNHNGQINVRWAGAQGDGINDDTAAIQAALDGFEIVGQTTDVPPIEYRSGLLIVPAGKYRITGQITIPPGVSIRGDAQFTSYNLPGFNDSAIGSVFWLENTVTLPAILVQGKQLRGSNMTIENIKFSHGQTLRLAGPYSGECLKLDGAFMLALRNCDFIELGYTTGLKATSSNGIRVVNCNFIRIGDANNQQAMPPVTGYTYGNAIDFTTGFDSWINSCFIEACGGQALTISTNTKVENCFIDLCKGGVKSTGDRNQIVGSSIKWNQEDGIFLSNSDGMVISGCVVMGNNYKSAATSAAIGYAVRFDTTSSKYVTINACNFVDDYEGITAHSVYKTVRQGGINLGSGANTTAIISGCFFSDADGGWDATLTSNNPVIDTNSRITAGFVLFVNSMVESSGPTNLRSFPYTTAAGTTLGSVTKRIAYRDKNGTVVGQIPIYDSIT